VVAYTAKVRITVRAGETRIVREGSGSGEAKGYTAGQAHELALKSGETDATKRALASFGNSFGLALYDPEQSGVKNGTAARFDSAEGPQSGPWVLHSASGEILSELDTPRKFADSLRQGMSEAATLDDLFGFWQQNVQTVRALHRLYRWNSAHGVDGIALLAHLKVCARCFAQRNEEAGTEADTVKQPSLRLPAKIDKSMLTINEPKRVRCKEHLRYVAKQPCTICGRTPSHAHHIRHAQPRGVALKVSDEFTVPLCAIHHGENHATGDERTWWEKRKIDPLAVAAQLWNRDIKPTDS
jgi:hypothetical protein